MGTQLAGKTLGIIGLGRAGQAVASRARALEMRILGHDPFISNERAAELGVGSFETVEEMLPEVDYLTVHTPLTDETRGLIGKEQIAKMKPGAKLINCARGGIYAEESRVEGLRAGQRWGVALAVFASEPCVDSPLFEMQGVLCTPHLGASTEEAQTQVAVEGVNLLIDFLKTGEIRHAVNVAPLDSKTLLSLHGFLDVAYRLGLLLGQARLGGIKACRVLYRGEIAEKNTKFLTSSFAAGLLRQALAEDVNIVNAELLLRERGVEITAETRADMGAFSSVMAAEMIAEKGSLRAAGSLFGQNMPRLVELDGHRLEAYLDGRLLVLHHRDVPGIIGVVGTIFGRHIVNIAQMAVGRDAPGGQAIGVLNVDNDPPQDATDEVLRHSAIERAWVIRLPESGELPAWLQSLGR